MSQPTPFADLRGLPYYDEPSLHMNLAGQLWAWEFEGWKAESMSWKTGCYIHGGLSRQQTVFRGPDVKEFFSSILVNSLENFPVGSMKHGIYCNEDGLMTAHAILQRNDEHEYRFYAGQPWPHYKLLASQGPLPRRDGAHALVPVPDRRPDVAGDARARHRREPPGHRVPALPQTRRSTGRPSRSAASA